MSVLVSVYETETKNKEVQKDGFMVCLWNLNMYADLLLKPYSRQFTPYFSIGREQRGTREVRDQIKEEKQEM